jgi:pyrroloquinoline quinone biosynthesis protein D
MSTVTLEQIPALKKLFRLQWEPVQERHVLLYPEGMVQLNQSAGEILKRVNEKATVQDIVTELETTFNQPGLGPDVIAFLEIAHGNGWITFR